VANALITGGASGFGAEVARQLVRRGDRVVLLDVDDARGQSVAGELGADYLHCDVSDHDQVLATTAQAEELLGGLDLFFLNAGISTGCGIDEDFDLLKYRRPWASTSTASSSACTPRCRCSAGAAAARSSRPRRWPA
jgi:NAD(P)-dependent dehydrogenase (short-subunit alcohol dehydrogenase family)